MDMSQEMDSHKFRKGHTYLQWIFAIMSNLPLLAYGMECGWISPTTKILRSEDSPTGYPLSNNAVSWIASSMSMSAIFGVSFYSFIADRYGRKISVILVAIPEAISWVIKLSYSSTTTLIIARVFAGLAAGGCFNVVPMYIKEISQDDLRGVLGTLPMIMQTVGIFIMYIMGAYLKYYTVIIIVLVVPLLTILLMILAPESPAFLVKTGQIDKATKVVAQLRGLEKDDKIVQSIVNDMISEDEHFKSLPNITLASILRNKTWRRGFILITLVFTFHGLNGAYAIVTYASAILVSTGVEFNISPEIQTLSFPIVMIVGSLALVVCVEKCGRKPLLIASFLVTAISMAAIAAMMIIQFSGASVPSWLPVLAMMLAVAMYGAGVSPLPYIMMTEMFSFQIRAKVMGTVVTYAWTMTFLLVTIYAPMADYLGQYSPFIFYAIINLTGAIFTLFYMPETRGKSEEEIMESLFKDKRIRNENTI